MSPLNLIPYRVTSLQYWEYVVSCLTLKLFLKGEAQWNGLGNSNGSFRFTNDKPVDYETFLLLIQLLLQLFWASTNQRNSWPPEALFLALSSASCALQPYILTSHLDLSLKFYLLTISLSPLFLPLLHSLTMFYFYWIILIILLIYYIPLFMYWNIILWELELCLFYLWLSSPGLGIQKACNV